MKASHSIVGLPLHSDVIRYTIDISNSDVVREKGIASNLRQLKLNADARLHPTACIALDSIRNLESVQCAYEGQQLLLLTFDSEANANLIFNKWNISGAEYVNGGPEWGCLNLTTQQPAVIFERISNFRLKDKYIFIETFKHASNSPFLCFANISMHLVLEHGSMITSPPPPSSHSPSKRQVEVPTPRSTCIFCSWSLRPLNPSGGQLFLPGQTVTVSWSYSNIDDTTKLKITLYRKQLLVDASISTITTQINTVQSSFVIPANLATSPYDQYYFQFGFSSLLISHQNTSATFYIPTQSSIIPGTTPAINNVFYPGDIVPLSWQSVKFPAASQVTVYFKRARPIIPDVTLATFTVLAIANSYNYTIQSTLDNAANDKYYYFEFNYCTSLFSLNCIKTTNNFFVITRPHVIPTFPLAGASFSPSQSVTLTWTSANFVGINNVLTITLRHYNYLLPDSDTDTFTCTVQSSGSCSRTLPATGISLAGYYFEFNWCQHWYSTGCTAHSNKFTISAHAVGSWNYDAQHGQALAPKALHFSSCPSLCPTRNIALAYLCNICANRLLLEMQVNCTNCWATFDYSLVEMDILHTGNSTSLDKIAVRMNSSVSVNLDFILRANFQLGILGLYDITPIPIGPSIMIPLGFTTITLGFFFAPSILWNITVDGIGNLTAGINYQWQSNLAFVSTPGNTSYQYEHSLSRNMHPTQGNIQGDLDVDLAFRPAIEFSIGLFVIALGTEGYIAFESAWRYPPFSALSTTTFDWDPREIAPFHLSFPTNACLTTHYIQYHTNYGIRNTDISITFDILDARVKAFTGLELSLKTQSFFDIGPYELTSGCMYPVYPNTNPSQTIYLVLNRQFNSINDTNNRYLSSVVVTDLANALNISQIRIYYNSTFSVQQNQMTGIMIALLPSNSVSTSEPTVAITVKLFQDEIKKLNSLLYSGIVTKLVNPFQTNIMNHFN
ncbi:unnamed protein product [Rotaria socialis]|uniref:Ig-like domain-containing protein n=1 Tax=Rotaria socialis TaxID=392032 RepID=A0A818MBL0_9BILA|nr:unnamed protein product [Rotaria socialis]